MSTQTIETDYLVVGAGAAGMAFTDALLSASDAQVVMIDRQHAPGGHWLDINGSNSPTSPRGWSARGSIPAADLHARLVHRNCRRPGRVIARICGPA